MAAPASETGFYLSTNTAVDAADTFLGTRTVGALAAGATSSGSSTFTIPEATGAGAYYVIAHADWPGQVDETSNANNTRSSGSVRIGPDLVVSAVGVPAATAAGESFAVSDTTRNQGAGSALPTLTRFYLSANTVWDVADLPLGEREVGPLASGASTTASTTLVVPGAMAPGTYYLLARADAADTLAEVAENNNLRSGVLRVGIDLLVSAITGPGMAAAGDTITMTESTTNAGGAEAPESTTAFYLSVNSTFDAGDVRLASRLAPSLDAGASSMASVALPLPPATAAGTYYVLARADELNEVVEMSEANNVRASGALKIGPDLTVLTITVPAIGEPGGALSVTDTQKNQGGAASSPTQRAFYLSVNTSLDASDVELARGPLPSLAPSASHSATETLMLPASLATGSYYVLSVADPANVVAETIESNNVRASAALKSGPNTRRLGAHLAHPGPARRHDYHHRDDAQPGRQRGRGLDHPVLSLLERRRRRG